MSKADEIEDKEVKEFLKFIEVANDICKERGKEYKFECPICKGNAHAIKSDYNGHLWAKCEKCDMNVQQ
jgi:hypothetical protein